MNQTNNTDLVDYLVAQVVERLALRILGPMPPPAIHPSEYQLLIALGKGRTNPEIAEEMGVKIGVVANKIAKLAQYGAVLGVAVEGKQVLNPNIIQLLDHEEEDAVA